MDSAYLSNLQRAMSAAKTQSSPICLIDTILATQLAVSPPDKVHSHIDVDREMESFRHTRYSAREHIEMLFRFLKLASMTIKQCERLAQILMDKHSFKLRYPVDASTLAVLECAEFECFTAAEAKLAADNEVGRTFEQLRALLDRSNWSQSV
jgi:hypothetical protein